MLGIVTEKLAMMNAVDFEASDQLAPLYSVDVLMGMSPERGVLSCGIWVYRMSIGGDSDLLSFDDAKLRRRLDRIREEGDVVEEQIDGPFMVTGKNDADCLANAERELRRVLDRYGNNCDVKLKAPSLKARSVWEKAGIRKALADGSYAVQARKMADSLRAGFRFDPWARAARRGPINAQMSRR